MCQRVEAGEEVASFSSYWIWFWGEVAFCELRLCVGLQRFETDSGGQFDCFIEKFLPTFSISMLYSPIRDVTEFCIHHRLER